MSQQIPIPGINGDSDAEKLRQIRSYLYQLANQLNRTLDTLSAPVGSGTTTEDVSVAFARLRPLIMESSEIAAALGQRLKGTFVTKDRALYTQSYVWSSVSDAVLKNSLDKQEYTTQFQTFLVYGIHAGLAVLECWVMTRGGSVLQTGSYPVRDMEMSEHLAVPGVPGDRITILSDQPFTIGDE